MKLEVIDIYEHVKKDEEKEYPPKPQYVREGLVFTCPICAKKISLHSYLNGGYWEAACERHLIEEHHGERVARGKVAVPNK